MGMIVHLFSCHFLHHELWFALYAWWCSNSGRIGAVPMAMNE